MLTRFYTPTDYSQLVALYQQSTEFLFDEVTDAESALQRKITRDPESIIVVEEAGRLVGSVCIIEDGRIALLFRLVAENTHEQKNEILSQLIQYAEAVVRARGYVQLHNTAPADNAEAESIRTQNGFNVGKDYTWYWKGL